MRNRLHTITHRFFASAAIAVLALLVIAPVQAAQDPMAVVKSVVDPALQILADKQSPLHERQEKLRSLVNSNFDFTAMSRSALGYHWRDLNDSQRSDFTRTFTSFIQDSYLTKMNDYSGQEVQFLGQSQPEPGIAEVKSQIRQPGGKQPVQVNYVLRQENGRWLIYDVTVDNISIIANYRNQFNRVINRSGFDTLIADLKSKQEQLAAQLGTRHSSD